MWHSHQLHPVAYSKDLNEALGKILEHDDTDSDRTKGKKLDVGFSGTTKQWEDTFGTRYWKVGAMYKGNAPSPITSSPFSSSKNCKKVVSSKEQLHDNLLQDRNVVHTFINKLMKYFLIMYMNMQKQMYATYHIIMRSLYYKVVLLDQWQA